MSQYVTLEFKRGTASQWTSVNPTLAPGEPGFELDTGKMKIGNGTTAWNDLSYVTAISKVDGSVTIGKDAGNQGQSVNSIAIGNAAGAQTQGLDSIAIGYNAGAQTQGSNSIALGKFAGYGVPSVQADNTIILDASGLGVNGVAGQTGSFYVRPIREDLTKTVPLMYDPATYEIVRGMTGGAGGVTGATGMDGVTGPTGKDGLIGPTGATGIDGLIGPTGATGIDGLIGPTGPTGINGLIGPTGPTGTNGLSISVQGSTGILVSQSGSIYTISTNFLNISGAPPAGSVLLYQQLFPWNNDYGYAYGTQSTYFVDPITQPGTYLVTCTCTAIDPPNAFGRIYIAEQVSALFWTNDISTGLWGGSDADGFNSANGTYTSGIKIWARPQIDGAARRIGVTNFNPPAYFRITLNRLS